MKKYDIEKYIEKVKSGELENKSVGGSPCYIFDEDNVVLVKYKNYAQYGTARSDIKIVKEKIDALADEGVPCICRILETQDEIEGDKSICWVLEEKAKGKPCTEYRDMNSVEDEAIADLANYPEIQYLGTDQHIVNGVPYEHIKDMVYATSELLKADIGLEPKHKNVFYDADPKNGGFTHIDYLYHKNLTNNLCPWETSTLVMGFAMATLMDTLPKSATQKVRQQMVENLKKAAYKVIPEYQAYKPWIEKEVPTNDPEGMKKYVEGLEKMRKEEIDRNVRLIKNGEKEIWNCRPSRVLLENIEYIPPKKVDLSRVRDDSDWLSETVEEATKRAFVDEMQAEIKSLLKESEKSNKPDSYQMS